MKGSKVDDYPKAIKIITLNKQITCNRRYFLRAIPPEDMLEVKELYVELLFRFDSDVDVANRKIERIGVASNFPILQDTAADTANYYDSEYVADGNRWINLSLDLTPLIVSKTGDNWVEILFPSAFEGFSSYGTFHIWKVDLVHTTQNVRGRNA